MTTRTKGTNRAGLALATVLVFAAGCAAGIDDEATGTSPPAPTMPAESVTITTTTTTITTPPEAPPVTIEPDARAAITTTGDAPDATDPAVECRRITDFDGEALDNEALDAGWFVVNDGVMGGRSNGGIDISDSVMRFSGTVVTDGGGFTSVRYRLEGSEMADTTRISMRVRSDQRVYGVTLEDDAEAGQRSVSHRADLDMAGAIDDNGWTITTVEYSRLEPSVFGRAVDAPPFDPSTAREIGIIIADGADGDFSLDVDWIDVCR